MGDLILPVLIVDADPTGAGDDGSPLAYNPNNGHLFGVITGTWTQIGGSGSGLGTVTSVGLVGTANQVTVTGSSPITTAGSFTLSVPSTFAVPGTIQTDGTLFSQTASVTVANTLTETTVIGAGQGTVTLPANYFVAGKAVRIKIYGYHSASGNPTNRIRIKLGGTTVLDTTAVASHSGANELFTIDALLICRTTGATGTVYSLGVFTANSDGEIGMVNTSAATIDTTGTLAIDITWQWGTADPGNTATVPILVISKE